jgi:replicative DNA helicase
MSLAIAQGFADPLDKLPPHSIEAEMCLLASMMLDRDVAEQAMPRIEPDFFYITDHRLIFEALRELIVTGKPVDVLLLREELAARKVLDEIGGTAYLAELLSKVPNAAHGLEYATLVRDKALLRQMITLSNQTIRVAYEPGAAADVVLDHAAGEMLKLAEKKVTNPIEHLGKVAADVYEMIEDHSRKGVPTGFDDLDDMLHGLMEGELIIVAARPSMGKTAFAMNVMQQIAQQQIPVAVFSLEMSKQQLAQRMLCTLSEVDQNRVRKGDLTNDMYQQLARVVVQLRKLPIYVDDSPQLTVLDLRTKARRLKHDHHIRAIMIDYMQLMDNPGPDSRQQQISEISRGIKAIARDLEVPVICLSQLNRASEQREGHKPRMSDLRESGSIEQDADVVMLLHREDYYHQADPNYAQTGVAELIIAKQRNGPTGTVELVFDGKTTRFKNKYVGAGM